MKSLCLNCLSETEHDKEKNCKICGQKKPSNSTLESLKMVIEKRVNIPDNKKEILFSRYDLGLTKAIEYAKTVITADDIKPCEGERINVSNIY